jgi:hypothetical protein
MTAVLTLLKKLLFGFQDNEIFWVSKNKGSKNEEARARCRKLRDEQLHNPYFSANGFRSGTYSKY